MPVWVAERRAAAATPGMVPDDIQARTGFPMTPIPPSCQVIPPGVFLEDGLSEDGAVNTALTNNSAFQATLAQLGMARGDAVQAKLIANPQLLVCFPAKLKEGQYTLYSPICWPRFGRTKTSNSFL